MRKFTTILLTILLSINSLLFPEPQDSPDYEQLMLAQEEANQASSLFYNLFIKDRDNLPTGYAGHYIDNENHLVICITNEVRDPSSYGEKLYEYRDVVKYQTVSHSYEKLNEIAQNLQKDSSNNRFISSIGISARENRVKIVTTSHIQKRTLQKKYKDILDYLSFQVEEKTFSFYTSVKAGMEIKNNSGYFSAGICGIYNNYPVLITCGHTNAVGTTIKDAATNETLGNVILQRFASNSFTDFSVVRLNNISLISHYVYNGSSMFLLNSPVYTGQATEGQYVKKYSQYLGFSYGQIISINAVLVDNETTLLQMPIVTILSGVVDHGDSGAPVFAGNNALCGIVCGGANNTYTFTPISRILSIGVTPYTLHQSASWTNATPTVHYGYCTLCQANVAENHSDFLDSTHTYCTRCGYHPSN